jgi:hypothetical protein
MPWYAAILSGVKFVWSWPLRQHRTVFAHVSRHHGSIEYDVSRSEEREQPIRFSRSPSLRGKEARGISTLGSSPLPPLLLYCLTQ